MRRVSSADLVRNFSEHSDAALAEPIVITRNGRDRLVIMDVERYREMIAVVLGAAPEPEQRADLSQMMRALVSAGPLGQLSAGCEHHATKTSGAPPPTRRQAEPALRAVAVRLGPSFGDHPSGHTRRGHSSRPR
jgi:PHD/YefM family antitoxin component YafN of YafNO toxin-antitoxin module